MLLNEVCSNCISPVVLFNAIFSTTELNEVSFTIDAFELAPIFYNWLFACNYDDMISLVCLAPYGMGGPQNMGNGYYPNSAGFMNNFDGSSQMNNFMGSPYQSHMGIRNTPVMGGGHFGGMGGSGFGGGGRFNGGDQYGGFGGNFSPMQNAQFGMKSCSQYYFQSIIFLEAVRSFEI